MLLRVPKVAPAADQLHPANKVEANQQIQKKLEQDEGYRVRNLESIDNGDQDESETEYEKPNVEPRASLTVVYLLEQKIELVVLDPKQSTRLFGMLIGFCRRCKLLLTQKRRWYLR